jgi:hypothetical protein
VSWQNARRYTYGSAVRRHIGQYDSIGANQYIVTNGDGAKQNSACADVNAIANARHASLRDPPNADSDAVPKNAVVANYSIVVDDNAAEVVDAQPVANRGSARQLDARGALHQKSHHLIQERKRQAQRLPTDTAAPAAKAVDSQRPKPGA